MSLFIESEPEQVHAFMQWKGTDACLDFHCECGAHCHFDGYFAYVLRCPHCLQEWEMPAYVIPRKRCEATYAHEAQVMEPDEEML